MAEDVKLNRELDIASLTHRDFEILHDQAHSEWGKILRGDSAEFTFNELFQMHRSLVSEMMVRGITHVAPIDKLDSIRFLENDKKSNMKTTTFKLRKGRSKYNYWVLELKTRKNPFIMLTSDPLKNVNAITGLDSKMKKDSSILIDSGRCEMIEEKDKIMLNFHGKKLIGNWAAQKNNELLLLQKGNSVTVKGRPLGEPFSDEDVRTIFLLASNRVGASLISRHLDRPVRSINAWRKRLGI